MSSKPWFAWFPADYRAKTAHLTFEQDGAYRRMLDAYYERRGPLPMPPEALYRLCSAQSESERKAVDYIAKQYFKENGGQLHHPRCDEQIEKEKELHNKWVESGRKGGLRQAQGRLKGRGKGASTIPSPSLSLNPSLGKPKKDLPPIEIKKVPKETSTASVDKNREIATLLARGDVDAAKRLRDER